MGRKVAMHDWSSTPLGPIETWPAVLRTTVSLVIRSGFAKCLCWGPEHIAIYNDAFVPILGEKGDCIGLPFSVIWAEAWANIGPIAEKAMSGQSTFIVDYPLEVSRHAGRMEEAFFTFSYSPVVDETGKVCGFMDTVVETTDKVRFERGADLRNRELIHRMKNSYALVRAVVNQTARTSLTKEDLHKKLIERLDAMGQAQDILSLRKNSQASVRDIVRHAVARFNQDAEARVSASGPEVLLNDERTFALTLALHELGTNATKYGALSVDAGKIVVEWTFGPDDQSFHFVWKEINGPPVASPATKGFGTFLIRQVLAAEFEGDVELDYGEKGLICTMRSPNFGLLQSNSDS